MLQLNLLYKSLVAVVLDHTSHSMCSSVIPYTGSTSVAIFLLLFCIWFLYQFVLILSIRPLNCYDVFCKINITERVWKFCCPSHGTKEKEPSPLRATGTRKRLSGPAYCFYQLCRINFWSRARKLWYFTVVVLFLVYKWYCRSWKIWYSLLL